MILIIQAETTGIPDRAKKLWDPAQPRVIQLAAVQYTKDRSVLNSFFATLQRDGWTSAEGARAVHGLSERLNDRYGVAPLWPLGMLCGSETEPGMFAGATVIAGQGVKFQKQMIQIELYCRARKSVVDIAEYRMPTAMDRSTIRWIDVTEVAGVACNLPARGTTFAKAYEALIGEPWPKTYHAMKDIQATASVFWELVKRGAIEI